MRTLARTRAPVGKQPLAWDKDPNILARLEEHGRLVRAGLDYKQIAERQQISIPTFFHDRDRLTELARRAAGVDEGELRTQADRWLRECIADADRQTAETDSYQFKAMYQANKKNAVDSFTKLWGIQKPTQTEKAVAGALNGLVQIRLAEGFGLPPLEADSRPVTVALLPEGGHGSDS